MSSRDRYPDIWEFNKCDFCLNNEEEKICKQCTPVTYNRFEADKFQILDVAKNEGISVRDVIALMEL